MHMASMYQKSHSRIFERIDHLDEEKATVGLEKLFHIGTDNENHQRHSIPRARSNSNGQMSSPSAHNKFSIIK
jgi:hypothetical protein